MSTALLGTTLRRWGWLVIVTTLVVGGGSFAIGLAFPRTFAATAVVLVQQQASPVPGTQFQDVLVSERLTRTYAQMILAQPVLAPVANDLGVTVESLRRRLTTRPILETQLIQVTAEDASADGAQRLANSVAQSFMDETRRQSLGGLAASKDTLSRQVAKLTTEIEATSAALDTVREIVQGGRGTPQDLLRLQQLQSQLGQAYTTLASLLKTLNEVELAEVRIGDSLRLVDPAVEPSWPIRPNLSLISIAGVLVGVTVGSIAALLLQRYSRPAVRGALRESGALAPDSAAPSIDEAPTAAGRQPESLVAITSATAGAERNLSGVLSSLRLTPARSIVVTSPALRTGTAGVAASLARVIARGGKRVLLVDANLRRPTVHTHFGLSNRRGLADLLRGGSQTIDDVVLENGVTGVRIVTAGSEVSDPVELLSSPWMRALLNEMHEQAETVVIDTPPILLHRDAQVLAAITDATVLVVESPGGVPTDRARRMLNDLAAPLLGMVVDEPLPQVDRPSQLVEVRPTDDGGVQPSRSVLFGGLFSGEALYAGAAR